MIPLWTTTNWFPGPDGWKKKNILISMDISSLQQWDLTKSFENIWKERFSTIMSSKNDYLGIRSGENYAEQSHQIINNNVIRVWLLGDGSSLHLALHELPTECEPNLIIDQTLALTIMIIKALLTIMLLDILDISDNHDPWHPWNYDPDNHHPFLTWKQWTSSKSIDCVGQQED